MSLSQVKRDKIELNREKKGRERTWWRRWNCWGIWL